MLGLCATLLAHIWIKYVFLPAILGCLLTFKKHDNGKNYVLRTTIHFATLHDFAGYWFSIAWHRIDFEWSWLRTPERYWYYRSIPEWVAWHWCSEWGKKVAATWSILAQPNWKSYWWSLNHPNISALGVKGRLNNVKKNLHNWRGMASLIKFRTIMKLFPTFEAHTTHCCVHFSFYEVARFLGIGQV